MKTMEIILKKDVSSIGKMGSIVKVKDGYARNYLIPQGIGIQATTRNLKLIEKEVKIWKKKADIQQAGAQTIAQEIEKLSLSFARKTGDEDKIFGSVTSLDIEKSLKENGVAIDRRKIILEEPIKTLGIFTVLVKLHPEVTANLRVLVVKE